MEEKEEVKEEDNISQASEEVKSETQTAASQEAKQQSSDTNVSNDTNVSSELNNNQLTTADINTDTKQEKKVFSEEKLDKRARETVEKALRRQEEQKEIKVKEAPQEPLALSFFENKDKPILETAKEESGSAEQPASKTKELKWYVVHVYSGFEHKVKANLEERIKNSGLQEYFGEIHIPQEEVVELIRGQKKKSSKKFFPSYIIVQMVLTEETWQLVRYTPKVTGFVGDQRNPSPLSDEEVARLKQQMEEGAVSARARMSFEEGQVVKVIDGPFTDFTGTIEEVKPDKEKVKVLISIFGRATPVELDFVQIERI
ncbi:MAG: transcription termination/antitermination protein NusG [Candidatus Dadabacteria bacterium]|nr:MAG: transcription termination/antitermination protein NusG [Candidatus Dadabacteria bacterium]